MWPNLMKGYPRLPEEAAAAFDEAVLDLHPGVHSSAVVGIPDPRCGQVPVAVVEPAAGTEEVLDEGGKGS